MISINRLEEMAIEELETKLNNWKEQVELQSNFIDSLLKATNNSEWLNKTILDDEASEIIEKIELDYVQLDQLKQTLTEIKEIAEENDELLQGYHKEWANNNLILQKISECEGNDEM